MLYCLCNQENKIQTFQKKLNAFLKERNLKPLSRKEISELSEKTKISGFILRAEFSEDRTCVKKATIEDSADSAWTDYPEIAREEILNGFARLYDASKCPPEIQRILNTAKISGNSLSLEKNPLISAESVAFDLKMLKFRLENVI